MLHSPRPEGQIAILQVVVRSDESRSIRTYRVAWHLELSFSPDNPASSLLLQTATLTHMFILGNLGGERQKTEHFPVEEVEGNTAQAAR